MYDLHVRYLLTWYPTFRCIVVRNGAHASISALDLVPGDVIVVKQGNKLPADMRFVDVSSDAMFDRAILTGKLSRSSWITRHY
jgi:P-type E1-E2 ATPase